MISQDEDIHLLSTGCPKQRVQEVSCVLRSKQRSLLDEKITTFYPLCFWLLKCMAWIQQNLGTFPLSSSPLCLLSFFCGIILLWGRKKYKWLDDLEHLTTLFENANNHYSLRLWWKTTIVCVHSMSSLKQKRVIIILWLYTVMLLFILWFHILYTIDEYIILLPFKN